MNASVTVPNADPGWSLPARGPIAMYCLIAAESAIFTIFVVAYIFYIGKSLTGPQPQDATASLAPLDFRVHVSVRYHARRRAWYDRLHRIMMLVIATGASAGVAAICGGLLREAEFLAVAVAVAGALELALSLPERARVEDALYRRFNALAAAIAEARSITGADIRSWEARRLLIRSDADDRLEALRRVCHNLEAEARAYPLEAFYWLWPWQRLCAQIVSLPPLRPLRR